MHLKIPIPSKIVAPVSGWKDLEYYSKHYLCCIVIKQVMKF